MIRTPWEEGSVKETEGVLTYFYWDGNVLLGDVKLERSACTRHREWILLPYSFEPLAMLRDRNYICITMILMAVRPGF
jgi:hypothetical protein